jgi:hypothetical protein
MTIALNLKKVKTALKLYEKTASQISKASADEKLRLCAKAKLLARDVVTKAENL